MLCSIVTAWSPKRGASRNLHFLDQALPGHSRTALPVPRPYVMVTSCGPLCLFRKKINLSRCLAGQAVGVKEVDEGIWLVSFMDYDLGYVDLEARDLQPLLNPFGPRWAEGTLVNHEVPAAVAERSPAERSAAEAAALGQ